MGNYITFILLNCFVVQLLSKPDSKGEAVFQPTVQPATYLLWRRPTLRVFPSGLYKNVSDRSHVQFDLLWLTLYACGLKDSVDSQAIQRMLKRSEKLAGRCWLLLALKSCRTFFQVATYGPAATRNKSRNYHSYLGFNTPADWSCSIALYWLSQCGCVYFGKVLVMYHKQTLHRCIDRNKSGLILNITHFIKCCLTCFLETYFGILLKRGPNCVGMFISDYGKRSISETLFSENPRRKRIF